MDTSLTSSEIKVRQEGDELVLTLSSDNTRSAVVLITESHCHYRPPDSRTWHRAESEAEALTKALESLLQCPLF